MDGLMMDYPLTVDRLLEHAVQLYPRKQVSTLLPDGTLHRYRYADLYQRSRRLARALVKLGVRPGDRVGTFSWNNYQHLELYFAIPGAAAVCHTLNIRLFAEQLAYVVNHAEDRVVFIDATLLPVYERVAADISCVEHYVVFNAGDDLHSKLPNVIDYEDLIAGSDDDFQWLSTEENMAAGLCYTSGTTGHPKGALYSHRSTYLHAVAANQANAIGIRESDVVLPVVPQFHAMAWGLPYACPIAGADMVMPGPHMQSDALAGLIEQQRVTIAAGVPTIWNGLCQELKDHPRDISCLRSLVVGGSAMPRALTESFERDLGINVVHAWGMTEMSPLGTVCNLAGHHLDLDPQQQWDIKVSPGRPVFGVEMRIMDESGDELPWDGERMGELQVRGAAVIRQYFKQEVSDEHFTADGWFRTGDVATIDADGYMRITDRTKDLVKSGGEWISTVELENAIMAHPQVLEAAVIAIPDPKWQERPLAAVVLTADAESLDADDIFSFLQDKVAKWWIPDHAVFIDEIPKTSVGKFDKKTLRARHANGDL